ncbi:MAG: hypothetical protein ACYCSN_17000 [Acidobacteriaceae bacterium]
MSIVTENVVILKGEAPNTLQQTGAFISQGATSLASGTYSLLTQPADLTAILAPAATITSLQWSGGTVTATTSAVIAGLSPGDTFQTTIANAVPAQYNGTFTATVTGTNTLTYALASNPGTATAAGTYTPNNQVELSSMVGTFFTQGTRRAVYVLELGPSDASTGPTALSTFIAANPKVFYSYLVPRSWDNTSGLRALLASASSTTAKTYYFITTTLSTYSAYTGSPKCALLFVEAPSIPTTEFSAAAPFQVALAYAPSSSNRMTPFALTYLYGVTAYPQTGNAALFAELKAANVSYVGTGSEGGITNNLLKGGKTLDGNDFTYWYSVDYAQVQGDEALANEVINGSNDSINPLWYDQNGINRLQDRAASVMSSAVSYALATGTVVKTALTPSQLANALVAGTYIGQIVVNADPFTDYVTNNPNDRPQGIYSGITVVYIPARNFTQIVFNLYVTDLLTQ